VRAARAEEGRALGDRRGRGGVERVELREARAHAIRAEALRQARGERAQHGRAVQLGQVREQGPAGLVALAVMRGAPGQRIQRLLQLRLQEGAAVLDHQHLLQPLGEGARGLGVERPGEADLPDAQAVGAREVGRDAGVGQRLAQRREGLAAHDDAEAGVRRIHHHPVEAVGAGEGDGGRAA
jgi:hypothetical protein